MEKKITDQKRKERTRAESRSKLYSFGRNSRVLPPSAKTRSRVRPISMGDNIERKSRAGEVRCTRSSAQEFSAAARCCEIRWNFEYDRSSQRLSRALRLNADPDQTAISVSIEKEENIRLLVFG